MHKLTYNQYRKACREYLDMFADSMELDADTVVGKSIPEIEEMEEMGDISLGQRDALFIAMDNL